ncbi:MAG: transposase [Gammaproteobacteria bacterium]|nr:transposase [Gammaproteobacteria bacterium]
MSLVSTLTDIWNRFQGELFPELAEEVGELHTKHRRLVAILDMVPVEGFVGVRNGGGNGRPVEDRAALARAFIAKAVWDFPTTRELLDRIACDPVLRRLCGWSRVGGIPSEATFSRAFGEFARSRLPERMHEALVRTAFEDTIVGHVSRDSTAIEAREKPEPKEETARREPGRPRKGEEGARQPSRLKRQLRMDREAMIDELPKAPAVGSKKNAQGFVETWRGYKLHIDASDSGIPISCVLTAASLHDSQAAIPLATLSTERVTYLYELMDAAYDAEEIGWHSYLSGHVPIIDVNTRRDKDWKTERAREARAQRCAGHRDPSRVRYHERATVERVNSRIKDSYGGRHVRVRGHDKVFCHLMFGVLALTVDQLMRLTL